MVPTPHIEAKLGDFAPTVLMPGDPMRSKFIAETFLTDVQLVNNVRGVQGYTGYYKGKRVSVMASGMGNPSIGIYSYELFAFYGVQNIIRIGTAGAFEPSLHKGDVLIASRVFTKTNYNNFYEKNGAGTIDASPELVLKAKTVAAEKHLSVHWGDLLSSDTFYNDENELELAKKHHLLGVEMEGASLYLNAQRLKKNGLVICTVSDNLITGEHATSAERQTAYREMIELAFMLA